MVPSRADAAPPTTWPRLLMAEGTLNAPPRLPRSVTEPSLSQSTACGPLGPGGIEVLEHKPDEPTTWPASLIAKANPTVSPLSGESSRISPSAPQITASKRITWNGVPPAKQVASRFEAVDRKSTRLNSSHLV